MGMFAVFTSSSQKKKRYTSEIVLNFSFLKIFLKNETF